MKLNRCSRSLVAVTFLAGARLASSVETSRGELLSRIDQAVEHAMERDRVPAISIGIDHRGELLVAKGYGMADLENRVPATEHTVYRIGSVTKQFTAAAILKLAEQGLVSLDGRIENYVPEFPVRDFEITIAQLLDHTSGIKGYTEMPEFWEKSRLDLTHEQMVALMASAPFEFEPGERYQYSNSAYYLAGLVIENVTEKTYAELLQETFFEPLGLFETHYLYDGPIIPNRAKGYAVENNTVVNAEPLSMLLPYAAGSLGSSAHDLLVWQRALTSGRVVNDESFERMTTPTTLNDGDETDYGLGLGLSSLDGHRKISHGGGINGFLTDVAWYPDDALFVVVLTNSASSHPGPLANQLTRHVLGLDEPEFRRITMDEDTLRRYVGTYNPGRSPIPVKLEDGTLTLASQKLVPVGADEFVAELDPDLRIVFEMEAGQAVAIRTIREGNEQRAKRTE
ncbi:MAG TPA: serine hydrolase domain-containing protein [Vicinamibacteria bacterium]|nr:serine hydrolase domain-containing protein [Vicinamibacteria bacterium]